MIKYSVKHPWTIIIITIAITLFFAVQLPRAELDNNNFRFIPKDDPSRITARYIDDSFKSTNYILIGLERKNGTVFDKDFLNTLVDYVEQVKTFSIVEGVDSLVSSNCIYGEDDAVIVKPLNDGGYFENDEQTAALREKVLSWDFYRRTLVSDDLGAAQVLVTLDVTDAEAGKPEITSASLKIRDMAREMFAEKAGVYATGLPVISATINESVKRDLATLLPLVIVVVLIIMYLPIRSIRAVLYVLLPVGISIIWTVGAMPLFNTKLSIISTVIPVVLVAVGNSYGLHIIMHCIDGAKTPAGPAGFEANRHLVLSVTRTVCPSVFLAALTTLISFLAFCWTKIPPLREFGAFTAFGVLAAFAASVTFLPAVMVVSGGVPKHDSFSAGKKRPIHSAHRQKSFSLLAAALIRRRKKTILAVSVLISILSAAGAVRLVTDNIFIDYFRPDTLIVRSDAFARERFGGSKIVSVMLEADTPELMLHPDTLAALDGLNTYLKEHSPLTGKVMSFTDFIKRMNLVLYAGGADPSYYEIPLEPERYGKADREELRGLIANYLFFISGVSGAYANDPLEPTAIRSVLQLATLGERDTSLVIAQIEKYIADNFPSDIRVTIGGPALAEIAVNHLVTQSVWSSMIIAAVCLFVIISLLNKSAVMGLVSLLPLFAAVIINFAIMGIAGIKLNIGTAMISSLAIGIGIDYTIHFIESLKRTRKEEPDDFLEASYRTSGAAILTDALSTGAGFAVLFFSRFVMLAHFGALVCLSLIVGAAAGLVIVPALLLLLYREKK